MYVPAPAGHVSVPKIEVTGSTHICKILYQTERNQFYTKRDWKTLNITKKLGPKGPLTNWQQKVLPN